VAVSAMETDYKKQRRAAFKRLAEKRVTKALKAIDSVSKLADSRNYVYTEEDVFKVTGALEKQLDKLKKSFATNVEEDTTFKL
jgi:predicted hydrolase (HD superfamily)